MVCYGLLWCLNHHHGVIWCKTALCLAKNPIKIIKPLFSYGFHQVFPLKSHETTIFLWFSSGFPIKIPLNHYFPVVFIRFSLCFPSTPLIFGSRLTPGPGCPPARRRPTCRAPQLPHLVALRWWRPEIKEKSGKIDWYRLSVYIYIYIFIYICMVVYQMNLDY